jgi:hypothetical protein
VAVELPGDDGPRQDDRELSVTLAPGDGAADPAPPRADPHRGLPARTAAARRGCPAEADDLVAEAFTKLFTTLLGGAGPDTAFRAYLLTVLRYIRYDRARQGRRLELSDDMTRHDPGVPWEDSVVAGLESRLASRAFAGFRALADRAVAHRDRAGQPGRRGGAAGPDAQRGVRAGVPGPGRAAAGVPAGAPRQTARPAPRGRRAPRHGRPARRLGPAAACPPGNRPWWTPTSMPARPAGLWRSSGPTSVAGCVANRCRCPDAPTRSDDSDRRSRTTQCRCSGRRSARRFGA